MACFFRQDNPTSETPTIIAFSPIWEDIGSIWLTKLVKIRYNTLDLRVVDLLCGG
jgi:hypothetical protein